MTVHDLTPLVFPEHFPRGMRGELKWQIQKWNLSRARRIITDSISSKNDVVNILRRPADTIDVVPLAPSSAFTKSISTDVVKRVAKKYALPKRFAVYVGGHQLEQKYSWTSQRVANSDYERYDAIRREAVSSGTSIFG